MNTFGYESVIIPFQVGDVVVLGEWFGLGEVVHGIRYEYLLEDYRGKEVTIKKCHKPNTEGNTYWYKIEEMAFTISHQMIHGKKTI